MAGSSILGAGRNSLQDIFSRGSNNYKGASKAPNFKNGSGRKNSPEVLHRAAIMRRLKKGKL